MLPIFLYLPYKISFHLSWLGAIGGALCGGEPVSFSPPHPPSPLLCTHLYLLPELNFLLLFLPSPHSIFLSLAYLFLYSLFFQHVASTIQELSISKVNFHNSSEKNEDSIALPWKKFLLIHSGHNLRKSRQKGGVCFWQFRLHSAKFCLFQRFFAKHLVFLSLSDQ